jgi:hypothetical protein
MLLRGGMVMTLYNGFCVKCGAAVALIHEDKHNEFHAEHEELIEWAQSVSKLFPKGPEVES